MTYDTIKLAEDLTASEFVQNGDVTTAMPVEAWVRLPDETVVDDEYRRKVMYHHCDDERCDDNPRLRARLHVDLSTRLYCPVHKAKVAATDFMASNPEVPTRYACADGHSWKAEGYNESGGREHLTAEA